MRSNVTFEGGNIVNVVDSLVAQLAMQSSDAWCVVQNGPFRLVESSSVLQRQLAEIESLSTLQNADVLESYVREICDSLTIHFQSGDCVPLNRPFGTFIHARLTKVQLSAEQTGFLLFFLEKTQVSPADEIAGRIQKLSPRQSEIMAGLYAGETNKSMSIRMGISEKTVEKHRAKVMENMAAKTSAELIRMITIAHVSGTLPNFDADLSNQDGQD